MEHGQGSALDRPDELSLVFGGAWAWARASGLLVYAGLARVAVMSNSVNLYGGCTSPLLLDYSLSLGSVRPKGPMEDRDSSGQTIVGLAARQGVETKIMQWLER